MENQVIDRRRRKWPYVIALTVILCVAAVAVWWITRPATSTPPAPGEIRRFVGHEGAVFHLCFSDDGRQLISGGAYCGEWKAIYNGRHWDYRGGPVKDQTVRVWDVETGRELHRMTGYCALAVGFADGRARAVAWKGLEAPMYLLGVDEEKQLRELDGGNNFILHFAAMSAKGDVMAAHHLSILLWDLKSGRLLRETAACEEGEPGGFALSAKARYALVGGRNKVVEMWNLETGKLVRRFKGHTDTVHCVAFSPDGRRAASGGKDATIRVWDVDTGAELMCLQGHESTVWSVAFSPDGNRLISGSGDTRLGNRQEFVYHHGVRHGPPRWPDDADELRKKHGELVHVDCTVRLWDLTQGRELHRFDGHESWVLTVCFSPDGKLAASGSADYSIRLWLLPQ